MHTRSLLLGLTLLALATGAAQAEGPASPEARARTVDTLISRMEHYVGRERTPAVVARLRARRPDYLRMTDDETFRKALTDDLYASSRDKHLQVWIEAPPPAQTGTAQPSPEERERLGGYGLSAVRRLPGNIGYLELTSFGGSPGAAAAVDQALGVLGGTDALIVDLRRNGGGGEAAFLRLLAHMFPAPAELTSIHFRECAPPPPDRPETCIPAGTKVQRRWTEKLDAPLFGTKPIYVLTSSASFSAAEEFAYDLQQEGRAVVVGETTGGGGNPSATMDLGPGFAVIMPIGRTVHPRSGATWEGVGVKPDVPVPAARALDEAYRRALERLNREHPGAYMHGEREGALKDVSAALTPRA